MTQNLQVRKTLSFLLLIGQLLSLPLMSAQRLDSKARKIQRDKDLLVMQKIAREYNRSAGIFNQKGSQAFVESLPDSIFINEQRKFFIKELKGIHELPLLEITNSQLLIKDSDTTFKMPIDQVMDGIFVFNDGALLYDFNRDILYNIESWKEQSKKAGKSAYLNWLQFLLIPQAEAKFKLGMGTAIGAIIGGLLGAWIGNYLDKKKQEAAESSAAAHEEKLQKERLSNLPKPTPPPVVSENPPATAKDKEKDDKKGTDKEKTDEKDKADPKDEKEDELSEEKLREKYDNVTKVQLFKWKEREKAEDSAGYPEFANKVLSDLIEHKDHKDYTKERAQKTIELFIFDNDGGLGNPENYKLLRDVKKAYGL